MSSLRSFGRRLNGLYWDTVYFFANIPKWVRFKVKLRKLGVSEKYIREAFSYLAQLDLKDFVPAGRLMFYGAGNFVHVKRPGWSIEFIPNPNIHGNQVYLLPEVKGKFESPTDAVKIANQGYEFTITDNDKGQIIVHRWAPDTVHINVQGYDFKNNWEEVYRTGRLVKDVAFVEYLKELYGDGITKPKVSGDRL